MLATGEADDGLRWSHLTLPTVSFAMRWALAGAWRMAGRVSSDRALLYGGASGLRILTFHETLGSGFENMKKIVGWCRRHFTMASPADADEIAAGRWPHTEDRILVTFDDGWESNFAAARWLADVGIPAIFFIVPSLIGRDADEYLRFHAGNRLVPSVPEASAGARGLSVEQVRAIGAMGHRIGAHNFAHRDLGLLHALPDVRYEVDNAIDSLSQILGSRCDDFAIAFGQPHNISDEAITYLKELESRGLRVYSCQRGLNVPGKTPSFLLRHACESFHPANFTRICVEGGGDRRMNERVRYLQSRVGTLPVANEYSPAVPGGSS